MTITDKQILENYKTIALLEKWGVVPLKNFGEVSSRSSSKKAHYKFISKLEKQGIIQKFRIDTGESTTRYAVSLSEAVHKKRGTKYQVDHLYHDLLVSATVAGFYKIPACLDVVFEHESLGRKEQSGDEDLKIHPDAEISLESNSGKELRVAIEVELSRKSETRIVSKFVEYANAKRWVFAFYFFTDERMLEKYLLAINSISDESTRSRARRKIIFSFMKNPFSIGDDLLNTDAYHNEKKITLDEIFK